MIAKNISKRVVSNILINISSLDIYIFISLCFYLKNFTQIVSLILFAASIMGCLFTPYYPQYYSGMTVEFEMSFIIIFSASLGKSRLDSCKWMISSTSFPLACSLSISLLLSIVSGVCFVPSLSEVWVWRFVRFIGSPVAPPCGPQCASESLTCDRDWTWMAQWLVTCASPGLATISQYREGVGAICV